MIDRNRCMASGDGAIGGHRCQAPATHNSNHGRLCARHAEDLRCALRKPNTVGNILTGRARTEEEIARLVVELPS